MQSATDKPLISLEAVLGSLVLFRFLFNLSSMFLMWTSPQRSSPVLWTLNVYMKQVISGTSSCWDTGLCCQDLIIIINIILIILLNQNSEAVCDFLFFLSSYCNYVVFHERIQTCICSASMRVIHKLFFPRGIKSIKKSHQTLRYGFVFVSSIFKILLYDLNIIIITCIQKATGCVIVSGLANL